MKINKILLLSFIVFVLQSTIIQKFRLGGITPNLNLIVIVLLVIYFDLKSVIIYSIMAGLFQDLYLSQYIGINIFLYSIIGITIINFESFFNKVNIISPIFLISVSTWIYNTVFYLFTNIMGFNFNLYKLIDIGIVENFFNVIWIIIIFNLTNKKAVERR